MWTGPHSVQKQLSWKVVILSSGLVLRQSDSKLFLNYTSGKCLPAKQKDLLQRAYWIWLSKSNYLQHLSKGNKMAIESAVSHWESNRPVAFWLIRSEPWPWQAPRLLSTAIWCRRERGKERESKSCPALLTSGPDVLLDITAAVIRESIAIACITYPVVSVRAARDRFIKLLPSRSPSQTDL